ncbi:iron ABC transporter permease [Synechococcus sp. 7002]|uniref:FecCD family ABC transporter permease n=1 Tax=Synechococcus sp. 7002 TaxID=1938862 RepID=UPI001F354CB1|nr:iron ABC transporter permease [Synechococcus sp. 7002]
MQLDRRVPLAIAFLFISTLAAMIISLGVGEFFIPPLEILQTLLGFNGDSDASFVLLTLRLPRILVAWLVGVGLAIAGTIIQSLTRNPLAEPGIIGINSGAALAAVSLIVIFPGVSVAVLPLAAFGGALAVTVLIYLIAWQGGSSPLRLILVGIGFNLIAAALTNLLVTFGNINQVSQALVWLAGSVYGRSWEQAIALVPWIVIGSSVAWLMSKELNGFHLGDDLAQGLGVSIEVRRGLLILVSTALAGASVATAGAIGFVGLVAPHIARQWVGNVHQGLLPTAALMGGCLVVVADLIGRVLFAPLELPCGIITAILGAPYFLYLLIKQR